MTTSRSGIFYNSITSDCRQVAVGFSGDAVEVRGPAGALPARWHFGDISPVATADASATIGQPPQTWALLTGREALRRICTEG